MRTFVIGDIHGCHTALLECLEAVNFDFVSDKLICLGDVCDRGMETYNVVETLMRVNNLEAVMGNHDLWFLEYLNTKDVPDMWIKQGGRQTIASYQRVDWKDLDKHHTFFNNLKPFHVEKNKLFVHGGLYRQESVYTQSMMDLAWNREFVEEVMRWPKEMNMIPHADNFSKIFIGHTPTLYYNSTQPIYRAGVWNLDTGCGKGGKLTIFNLDTEEYYQTKETHR